jgi:hypothetical protein
MRGRQRPCCMYSFSNETFSRLLNLCSMEITLCFLAASLQEKSASKSGHFFMQFYEIHLVWNIRKVVD